MTEIGSRRKRERKGKQGEKKEKQQSDTFSPLEFQLLCEQVKISKMVCSLLLRRKGKKKKKREQEKSRSRNRKRKLNR